MAVVIPRPCSAVNDSASGAQVIDGSLKFEASKSQYLTRTPSSGGNQKTWTWSGWLKRASSSASNKHPFYGAYGGSSATSTMLAYDNSTDDTIRFEDDFINGDLAGKTPAVFRDFGGGWYHVVISLDTTQSSVTGGLKIYVNGTQQTGLTGTIWNQDHNSNINSTVAQYLGSDTTAANRFYDGSMSQVTFIDGLSLGPGYFGYTDPLTNTWRPKAFRAEGTTINDGTTWSNNTSGTWDSSHPSTLAFDGLTTTYAYADSVVDDARVLFNTHNITITQTNRLRVYGSSGWSNLHSITSSGVTTTWENQTVQWHDLTDTFQTPWNLYSYNTTYNGSLRIIEVGGTILRDGVTENLDYGTNGFYLPFDGNSLIGKDQSGKGNDWNPVNIGGSNVIPKATGALPISNTVNGGTSATVGVRTDSNYSDLVLALPLVGSANDVSNQINSGSTTKAITVTNAVANYAYSNFYGGSYYFDGNGDYLTTDLSSVSLGSAYTIEFWWNKAGTQGGNHGHFCLNGTHGTQTIAYREAAATGTSSNDFYIDLGGSSVTGLITQTINTGQWNHFAFVHEGSGVFKSYLNGVLQTIKTVGTTGTMGSTTSIGGGIGSYTTQFVNGYVSDYRIYQAAKYTSDFIPASINPDILPDTPSGVAYGSQLTKVTDGAVEFEGTDDYLSFADSNDFDLVSSGTGDFTIEMYLYPTTTSSMYILSSGADATRLYYNASSGRIHLNNPTDSFLMESSAAVAAWTPNRWMHIAFCKSSSTGYLFIDGVSYAAHSGSFTLGGSLDFNTLQIGRSSTSFQGFISNLRIVKGTALYTANFTPPSAPLTDVTNTKLLCCQSNTSAIAYEVSPGTITANGDAAATTFNPFTDDINAVMGQETGYATLNPLSSSGDYTFSDGNLKVLTGAGGEYVRASFGVTSGKYYWEANFVSQVSANNSSKLAVTSSTGVHFGIRGRTSDIQYFNPDGDIGTYSGSIWSTNDTYSLALDLTTNELKIYTNSILGATVSVTANLEYFASYFRDSGDASFIFNFGQKPFKYVPPEGFQPLNYANLPSPGVVRPDQYVGVTTYTGTGSSRAITMANDDLSPDFVWIKKRSGGTARVHALYDSVRGVQKTLESNSDGAEYADTNALTAFNSDPGGFTVGSEDRVNENTYPYVAWCWKAGGNKNTFNVDDVGYASASDAGLTGAVNCTQEGASVGTKQGFSITVQEATSSSGATMQIPHGLTQKPDFIIGKDIDTGSTYWGVYHVSLGATKKLELDQQGASAANANYWDETEPTSSVIYSNAASFMYTSSSFVLYSWHNVPGVQKFGMYEGNNSADGTYVELGFRPAIIIVKNIDASQNWVIVDDQRDHYNVTKATLRPNSSLQEYSNNDFADFLSNGFKFRGNEAQWNNTETYIYAAWAESPMNNLYGAQSNAR